MDSVVQIPKYEISVGRQYYSFSRFWNKTKNNKITLSSFYSEVFGVSSNNQIKIKAAEG